MKKQGLNAALYAVALILGFALLAGAVDEITTMNQLGVSKGYLTVTKGVDAKATMYGNAYDQKVTTFDTTTNWITVSSSISTVGVAFVRNLTTNCNAVVTATFELYPGESLMGRLLNTNITVYAKTNGVPYQATNNPSATSVNVESIILAQ